MSNPFFSIIIPTYNRSLLIVHAIVSALEQQFTNFEIIVVDDGSTDDTEEVVNRLHHPKLRYFKQSNAERGAARNTGIKQALGTYITFCDSDDVMYPDYLQNAFETIKSNNHPEWLHVGYEIKKNSGDKIEINHLEKNIIRRLAKGNPLSCMGVFVKREILLENLFRENRYLAGSEDWELWLRLSARYPIVFDNRISAALHIHDERSVVHTNELKLQLRKYLSIGYAFEDEAVQKYYRKYRKMMVSYFDTYIALHLVLAGKKGVLKYLLKAIFKYPLVIFDRRVLAIFKHLLKRFINQ